jgi:Spy/CpxP family protein refolding chaperone
MNKKIILSLAAAILLSTSAFASCQNSDKSKGCKASSSNCNMMKKGSSSKKHGSITHMAMMLDLTDDQREKIRDIVKSSYANMPKHSVAFTDNSFDKQKFIDISKEKREFKMKNKADTIEKIYALLNDSQKKDFKQMIDMRETMKKNMKNKMMKKGSCNDKNCNGRG